MKYILTIIFIYCSAFLYGQAFVTTWKTDNPGTSNDDQISIPTNGSGYNYDIDWGDGNTDIGVTGDITHTYASAGTYSVSITGDFPQISFNNTGDKDKILTVEEWGDIQWVTFDNAFNGCSNLLSVPTTEAPNLSAVTSLRGMFRGASNFNSDLSSWDVSNVATMSRMFQGASSFNGDISSWDVSKVTNMTFMFFGATNFNSDLSSWNVSYVVYMTHLFRNASSFNGDISSWDLINVNSMAYMFYGASSFTGDISSWDVSNVALMSGMFEGATNFNSDLSNWDVSNVVNMSNMFKGTPNFTSDLSSWNVSNVTTMSSMFRGASSFTSDLSSWDVSKVTNMNYMFYGVTNFNSDISTWGVGKVTNMSFMFHGATNFNSDISSWDVSNATNLNGIFLDASSFNGDISSWDVSKVTNMANMFIRASSFNGDISNWDVSKVTNMSNMFAKATIFNGDISSWDVSKVTNISYMFNGASSFNGDISSWDVSEVTNMSNMFIDASSFNGDISSWDVSNVTDMTNMLTNSGLTTVNYDKLLNTWSTLTLKNNVNFGVGTIRYCDGAAGRDILMNNFNWSISDGGVSSTCPADQSITFDAITSKSFGGADFTLSATASSGLAVSFSSSDPSVISISGNTATIVGAGSVTLSANQAGDSDYKPAPEETQTITVTQANQTITFDAIPSKSFGDADFTLSATASSGLAVSFSSSDPSVISISGNTATIVGAGSVTLSANQSGNANYNAAAETQTITVTQANQTITFDAITSKSFDEGSFTLNATASSGLAVSFTSSDPSIVSISGNTATIVGVGSAVISANQSGDANYNAAAEETQAVSITKGNQSITFDAIPSKSYDEGSFTLNATASSGLVVSYTSSDPSIVSISGNTAIIVGVGSAIISANQAGDMNYNAAAEETQAVSITKGNQSITIAAIAAKLLTDAPFDVVASASSALAVTLSITGPATISGNTITLDGTVGIVTVTANQAGDANYNPATAVSTSFEVREFAKEDQTITLTTIADKVTTDAPFDVIATSTSGLAVALTVTGPATISGTTITLDGTVGTVTVTANQAGDDDYNPATAVSTSFEVTAPVKEDQTITLAAIADKLTTDAPFDAEVTSTSGLAVALTVTGPATISGTTITLDGTVGTVTVIANQAGNDDYNAATAVSTSFKVTADPCAGFEAHATVVQNVSCHGEASGSFEVTLTQGEAPFTYALNGDTQESGLYENIAAGTYELTVTDANGCVATASVTITEPEAITVSADITASNSISGNGSITVTATGGTGALSYSWSHGATSSSISDLGIGEYSVTVTDANGCSVEETYTVGGVTANENAVAKGMQFYPNPSDDYLMIDHPMDTKSIKIIDARGKVLIQQSAKNKRSKIDLQGLSSGVYFIQVDSGQLHRLVKR